MYPYADWPGPWHMWGGWGFGWMFPMLMMVVAIAIIWIDRRPIVLADAGALE